jgi:hypothetical protein
MNVETVRQRLLARGFPRLQMLAIVAFAGVGGFLTSGALLYAGLDSMAARYAIATAAGYLLFLALMRLWIAYQRRRWRIDAGDLPIDELPALPGGGGGGAAAEGFGGGGGSFGGGGASGSFGAGPVPSGTGSGLLEAVPDLDEAWPLAVAAGIAVAAVAGLVAVGLVIYASPVLFAEVLLDAAVVGAVYRRARRRTGGHWLHGVLRRTWPAAISLGLLLAAAGFVLQLVFPEARSIGAVLGR